MMMFQREVAWLNLNIFTVIQTHNQNNEKMPKFVKRLETLKMYTKEQGQTVQPEWTFDWFSAEQQKKQQ